MPYLVNGESEPGASKDCKLLFSPSSNAKAINCSWLSRSLRVLLLLFVETICLSTRRQGRADDSRKMNFPNVCVLSPPREQWRDLLRKWCVPMRAGCVYFGTLFRSCRKSARMMSPQWEQEGFFPGKSQYKRDARSWWMTIIKERLFFLSLFRNSNISTL